MLITENYKKSKNNFGKSSILSYYIVEIREKKCHVLLTTLSDPWVAFFLATSRYPLRLTSNRQWVEIIHCPLLSQNSEPACAGVFFCRKIILISAPGTCAFCCFSYRKIFLILVSKLSGTFYLISSRLRVSLNPSAVIV